MELIDKYNQKVHVQDYSGRDSIEGIETVSLKKNIDESGSFTELLRLSDGNVESFSDYNLKQINFSTLGPKHIKAFHVHKIQTDIWFVPPSSKILLILADLRKNSDTTNQKMRLALGGGQTQLVKIPPGIAHGCKNLQNQAGEIIYFINNQFDPEPENCDEWRLPWDIFGQNIWEIQKE